MIDISFTVTKSEYIEAQKLFSKKRRRQRFIVNLACIAIGAVGVGIVVFANGSHSTAFLIGACLAYAAFLTAILILSNFLRRYLLGRRFKTESRFLTNAHLQIDADSYRAELTGIGQSNSNWTAFDAWAEGPNVFIIVAGFTFRAIPKRSLSTGQQDELRALLSAKIAKA